MSEAPNGRPQSNRRRSRRFSSSGQARIECRLGETGLGRNLAVRTLDISETGIRLVLRGAVPVGGAVEIQLLGHGFRTPVKRLGKVIWCLPLAEDSVCAGVNFDKVLRYPELQAVSRPLA